MSLTPPERETIITMSDGEDIAHVWTAQRKVITRLRHNPAAVLTEEGVHEGTAWARFTLPARMVAFKTTVRSYQLTEEEKQQRRDRLVLALAARKGTGTAQDTSRAS